MARKNTDFVLKSVDDIFSSQEERDNINVPKVKNIPFELIDDFPDHPFKVRSDEEMEKLIDSISSNGVLVPALVRPKSDGRYEMISGHRRKYASEKLGNDSINCIVKDLTDDEAVIIMVDSNIQREHILPSEKAFAYKMRLEAMNRQGKRTDLTSRPVGKKLSVSELSEEFGDSERQIHRYIRLTYLVPELLEFVDEGRMKFRPAVELSYLDEDCQRDLVDYIDDNESTPSHAQAIRMKKLFENNELTTEVINSIMDEEKPNQKEKVVIHGERISKLIPKNVRLNDRENFICKAIEHYVKYLKARDERSDR